jgi:predicted nucleic acid-binding protein
VSGYFLDSSAVLKRYMAEAGTSFVQELFDPVRGNRIAIAAISGTEIVAAVARRARGGGLLAVNASRIIRDFRADFSTDFRLIDITTSLLATSMDLAERRALRGYDAVQLAAALAASSAAQSAGMSFTLVSADLELNAAATAEGLAVEDPNNHP